MNQLGKLFVTTRLFGRVMIYFRCWRTVFFLLLYLIPLSISNAAEADSTNSPIFAFKKLLSHPPVVEMMIVEKRENPEQNRSEIVRYDNGFTLIDPKWQIYKIVWQTNGFFLEYIPEEYSKSTVQITNSHGKSKDVHLHWICGSHDNEFWYVKPVNRQISYTTRTRDEIPKTWVSDLVRAKELDVLEAIQLGIRGLSPGSVVWSGSQFSGTGLSGEKYEGSLATDSAQRPLILKYRVNSNSYSVKYSYDEGTSPEAVFPSRYERRLHTGASEVAEAAFVVRKLMLATKAMLASELSPDKQFRKSATTVFTVTPTGTFYNSPDSGGRAEKVTAATQNQVNAAIRSPRWVVRIIIILFAIGGLVMVRSLAKKTNITKRKK